MRFTKLDANDFFWQVPLDEESAHLTTFITPFGRYYFRRMPFGITSAPEFSQKQMERALQSVQDKVCLYDDVLLCGKSEEEHDSTLRNALEACELLIWLYKSKNVNSESLPSYSLALSLDAGKTIDKTG